MNASKRTIQYYSHTSSLIVDAFNSCWAEMLNTKDVTYFAMLHSDVHADGPWLDTLIDELETKKLDILSVVLPIKSEEGATSTAFLSENDQVHRLTMNDVEKQPQTFTIETLFGPDTENTLLVNTGMWVAKVGEWMKEFDGFRIASQIVLKDGKYETMTSSEDWDFSSWAAEKGLKVGATTIIKAGHIGKKSFPNYRQKVTVV